MIFICSFLYLLFSTLIYWHVPIRYAHRDRDSVGYLQKAERFYKTGEFVSQEQIAKPSLIQQPVGYPFFISLIYKYVGHCDWCLIWVQIFVTLLSGVFLFFATSHVFGKNVATIVYALFCINLGYITFAQFILAESLLLLSLVMFFERFLYFVKIGSYSAVVLSGVCLGISTLVKPAALYYIIPVIGILVLHMALRKEKFFKWLLVSLLFGVSFFAPIKAYQLYNYTLYGVFQFGELGSYNLCVVFWSKVAMVGHDIKNSTMRNNIFFPEQKKRIDLIKGNSLTPESWVALKTAFLHALVVSPFIFIKTWIKEMMKTVLGLYATNFKLLLEPELVGGEISFFYTRGSVFERIYRYISQGTHSRIVTMIGMLELMYSLVRFMLAFIAILFLIRCRAFVLLLFFCSYISYFTLVTGFDGCARYRTMFEFVLLLLAGLGVYVLYYFFRKDRSESVLCCFEVA